MHWKGHSLLGLGLLVAVVMPGSATADDSGDAPLAGVRLSAEPSYQKEERLFRQGKFEEATEVWFLLYDRWPQASLLLYNIGLAYERDGQFERAISYYKLFLESIDPEEVGRSRAARRRARELRERRQLVASKTIGRVQGLEQCLIRRKETREAMQQQLSAEAREKAAAMARARREAEKLEARERLHRQRVFPGEVLHQRGAEVEVLILDGEWERGRMYVYFDLWNRGTKPHEIKGASVLGEDFQPVADAWVTLDEDRPRVAMVGPTGAVLKSSEKAPAPPWLAAKGAQPVDVLLETDGHLRGVIVLPGTTEPKREAMGLRVYDAKGQALAEVVLSGWRMIPITQEEAERERRAKERAKRGYIGGRVFGGALWMTEGDELAGASLAGLGLRITKGMHENWAFEADVIGARTGQASFDDGSTRRATLGRVLVGGVLRFGDKVMPTVKLKIGGQAGYFTAGDESSFAISGVWSFGAGLDARLGERWLLGLDASFTSTFDSESPSLEAGAHLAHSW